MSEVSLPAEQTGHQEKKAGFWLRQLRWVLPLLLLVLIHEVGSNIAGQKIEDESRWPAGAAQNDDLRRGVPVDLYWAVREDPERSGDQTATKPGAAEQAAAADDFGEEDDSSEASETRAKPEAGVILDVSFIYNRPLHAVMLMIACAGVAAWLVRVHPLFILPALIYTCAKVGEFYPVTDWPMYSNPDTGPSWYCYLADGEGTALPVRKLCGETAPKLKKRMRSYTEDLMDTPEFEEFGDRDDLPPVAWERCAARVLEELVGRSVEEGQSDELPPRLQLVRVDIFPADGTFREEASVLGEISTREVLAPGEGPPPNRPSRRPQAGN